MVKIALEKIRKEFKKGFKSVGDILCKLGLHKYELRHPFVHHGIIYGKLGLKCARAGCLKEKTIIIYHRTKISNLGRSNFRL